MTEEETREALRAAIADYRRYGTNEHIRAVLDRLTPSDDDRDLSHLVLPAFEATPPERWPKLIRACLRAEKEQRVHKSIVERTRRILEGAAEAEKALKTLERFVKVLLNSQPLSEPPWHPANHFPVGHPERDAIRSLESLIRFARQEAAEELQLHSRKTGLAASRAAGIGVIKGALRTCAPNARNLLKLAAYLATAVLDAGGSSDETVTPGMVEKALTPRERRLRAFEAEKS